MKRAPIYVYDRPGGALLGVSHDGQLNHIEWRSEQRPMHFWATEKPPTSVTLPLTVKEANLLHDAILNRADLHDIVIRIENALP